MDFSVISVLKNSVRIKTGIATFDVLITYNDQNKLIMKTPRNIFIARREDFESLAKTCIKAYLTTIERNTTLHDSESTKS